MIIWALLQVPGTGIPVRTTTTQITRGNRTSTTEIRITTTATTITECVQCGVSKQAGASEKSGAPFSLQLELFEEAKISVEQIFDAYYSCRRNKRNSYQAIEFETDLESNLIGLMDDINSGTYEIEPSSVFIVDKPVKREVFAASFRDRIVHHLLIDLINPCLEKNLIYDCYACRVGKGTHFGIRRLEIFMRSVTMNY